MDETQAALMRSNSPHRTLLQHVSDLVFELNPEGEIIYVNNAAAPLTGYQPEELLGRSFWQTFFDVSQSQQVDDLKHQWMHGDVSDYRLDLTTKSGSPLALQLTTFNEYVSDEISENPAVAESSPGRLKKILGLGQVHRGQPAAGKQEALTVFGEKDDELQQAQARAVQESQRYQDLLEFTPDGYLVTDAQGVIQEANQAAARLLRQDNLVGQKVESFLNIEDQSSFERLLGRMAQGGQMRGWETWLVASGPENQPPAGEQGAPAGEQISTAVIVGSVRGNDGEIVGLRWLLHDLSERRRAEEALRASEARFRTVFEFSGVGIDLADLDGRILASNPALRNMLGYTAEELRRMTYADITHPDDLPLQQELFGKVVRGEMNSFRIEKRYLHKNGSVVWALMTLTAVRDEYNRPQFLVKMVENITERKQMEVELAEVQRRLMDSAEVERILLAQELHDGPVQDLYGLSFQLEGLRDALQDDESRQYLDTIQTRLKQVVHVLRTTSGELRPPTLAPFGLEKAISSHLANFSLEHPELEIVTDLMPDGQRLPGQVRLGLYRIYQQALSNVVHHSKASTVYIRLYLKENEVMLEVEDDGVGFNVPKRWINLVRTGHFGLASASERAEAMGGKFQVISEPGEGARLRVTLPYPVD